MKHLTKHALIAILFLTITNVQADDWTFYIEPYAHMVTIEGDASIGRVNAGDLEVDFDTILENLHLGGMLNFKAIHTSGWGGSLDYSFMDLRDDIAAPRGGIVNAKVRQAVLQAELIYFQQKGDASLEYLLGLRWWDNDISLDLTTANERITTRLNRDVDWVDFFIGLRWIAPINDNWSYMLRSDIGMGDADFTSNIEVGVLYQLTEQSTLTLKYKSVWVDYEENAQNMPGYFSYDTATHGPAVAYTYQF